MRLGCRLSHSAFPSRRNSGEKMMRREGWAWRIRTVKPTGTVDLMMTVACGACRDTASMTCSTDVVSKCMVSGS